MIKAFVSFGYVGYMRPASGTWGSAAAIPAAFLLHWIGGFPLLAVASVVIFVLGVQATKIHIAGTDNMDPSEVVIDEVVGQWIALWPLSWGLWQAGSDTPMYTLWPGWIMAFFLFRGFDILKPGPIGKADRRHDALGVMLDDVYAGIAAGIIVLVVGGLWHGALGL